MSAQESASGSAVRVRFCPSPTGNPHVGMARTALFNWAYARHTGGTFVFRIEDTDSARDTEESYEALLTSLRWLGLDWDEGPEVGGPYGPYRQSQRRDLYAEVAARLVAEGFAYRCFCTPEDVAARQAAAQGEKRPPGYDGHCRRLDAADADARVAAGASAVVRFAMPDRDFTWDDLVRGPITFQAGHVPDFVIVRANGEPLYTLVNPVDDAAMRITHVLRGEDLLSSTPRQLALWEALHVLGVGDGVTPAYGHLPYVMGEGNKKLSKRDPESSLLMYVDEGYLPEGLTNYLALLGWSLSDDQDRFSLAQMAEAFDITRVNPNPARFDLKKCTALNADWIRTLSAEDFCSRLIGHLVDHGSLREEDERQAMVVAAAPLVQERVETLGQAATMLHFLLVSDVDFTVEPSEAAAVLGPDAEAVLEAAAQALSALPGWAAAEIEAALREALVDGLGIKPKHAFGPVRVAVTGRRVSPPLFESLELLGRDRSLARLDAARSLPAA